MTTDALTTSVKIINTPSIPMAFIDRKSGLDKNAIPQFQ